jgi:hypothetical protein
MKKTTKPCPACSKQLYPSRMSAISAAIYSSGRTGTPLRIYHCPVSAGWHLTHKAKVGGAA